VVTGEHLTVVCDRKLEGLRRTTPVPGSLFEVRQIEHERMTMIEKGVLWNEVKAVRVLRLGEH
jgi:hypothetical protein